jgi:hypothetical protein
MTANGPTTVTYHWEVSGAAQKTTANETLEFSQSGTQKVTTNVFSADCGEYTLTLRVTEPNKIQSGKTFKIQAP